MCVCLCVTVCDYVSCAACICRCGTPNPDTNGAEEVSLLQYIQE